MFDHDGVLVDTEYWYFRSNQKALSELGIDLDKNLYLDLMSAGKSCWMLTDSLEIDDKEVAIALSRRNRNYYYQQYLTTENIEISGVEDILESLSRKYKMCIVTTAKKQDFELIHKNLNITGYMEFSLTLGDYAKSKPHPDPYLRAIQLLGSSKEEAVIIEDSGRGLKSALAASIDCIIIQNEFTKSHDFKGAKLILESINDLPGGIEKLTAI